MRFALVAGALVLSASVSEARSVPPSPSKNSRTTLVRLQALNVRIGTPLSISKRTTVEGNASTSEDVLPNLNGSPSSTGTPKSRDPRWKRTQRPPTTAPGFMNILSMTGNDDPYYQRSVKLFPKPQILLPLQ
ncbi:hypothetical protein H4Q26_014796 [Puccinia striiformis f. sp. tritici PST-130]|nr:hypothetical protein H4Q26_014796 [Puccinia striiformis f. sp. tritici PST-130]